MSHRIVVYHPVTEGVAWEKDLTSDDVAALTPVIVAMGGPDILTGCWLDHRF